MVAISTLNNITDENLQALDEDDFNALRVKVVTERERRDALAAIPQNIAHSAAHFRLLGGSEDDLMAAIAPAPEEPVVIPETDEPVLGD